MGNDRATKSKTLRLRAEQLIRESPGGLKDTPAEDIQDVIHELQVHQIELEMQNEELRRTQLELHAARDKYADLYDFAPVGYFSVSDKGLIEETNLTGAAMLGVERKNLIGQPFSRFITSDTQDIFYLHRKKLIETKTRQGYELRLMRKDGSQFYARLECIVVEDDEGNIKGFRSAVSDIVEQKKAEEELRESEEKYRSLVESTEDSIYLVDRNSTYLFMNEKHLSRLDLQPDEFLGRTYDEFHSEDDTQEFGAIVEKVFETGRPIQQEHRGLKDNRHFLRTLSPVRESDGRTRTITIVSKDITERVSSEKALRESEEKYRTILENIEDGYFEVDIAGSFTFFNDSMCRMIGYSKDELIGMNNRQYMDEENAKEVFQNFNYVYRTEKPIKGIHWKLIRKDGSDCFVETSVSLIKDSKDHPAGFRGIARDVTYRKEMENFLRENKDNLDKAQEIAHVGSWRRDLRKDQGYWSNEMYRILGLTPGEPQNPSREYFLSRVHPADREHTASILKEAVEKKDPFDFEFRTIPIEGKERIIHSQGEVTIDETGTPVFLLGTNRDMTERRRLQDQLQQAQKMDAISILAGGVAHEFNNALMGIMGNIELLKMDLPEDERRDKYFEAMKGSGHRMSRLTHQLLAYAQGGKYQPKNLKLDGFVIQTLQILQHDLGPEVRVETHFSKDISVIKADNAQMQMVLSAILANSNEGIENEGLIRITAENKYIDEDFAKQHPGFKPGSYVCLNIEDDGKGMDEETKDGIFEPFFTTKFQGRGMGMAAVYGIVKNHDGWIHVDSELGKGTKVQIYLPVSEITVEEPKKAEVEIATGSGTILMIEDEDVVIEVTQTMLERLGYRVMVAKTGKDAIHITETFDGQIDLALLDIKLPDMEGGKVYPLIMKARPDLKVIVFSGYAIEGPAQKILDAGAQDFIQKPFSLATLSEKLKEVLEGK